MKCFYIVGSMKFSTKKVSKQLNRTHFRRPASQPFIQRIYWILNVLFPLRNAVKQVPHGNFIVFGIQYTPIFIIPPKLFCLSEIFLSSQFFFRSIFANIYIVAIAMAFEIEPHLSEIYHFTRQFICSSPRHDTI